MSVWKVTLGLTVFLLLWKPLYGAPLVGRWIGQWNDAVRVGAMDLTFNANGNCSGTIVDYPGLFGPGYSPDAVHTYVVTGTYTYTSLNREITFELHGGGPWVSSQYTAYGEGTIQGTTASGSRGLTVTVQIGGSMSSTIRGRTWSLTTQQVPEPASNPMPADGSTVVLFQNLILSWQSDSLATEYDVYFGISPDFSSAEPLETVTQSQLALSPLEEDTDYYWRVDTVNDNGTTIGEIWSFRTAILPWIIVDRERIEFIGEQTSQILGISNGTNTTLHYDLILLTGTSYFGIADPNQGISTGPFDRQDHTIIVKRDAILPGQTVTGRLAVISTLAPNSPLEVELSATGWDVQADFDMLYLHTLAEGSNEFSPADRQTLPVWRLDLTNNNPYSGPAWHVEGLSFKANDFFSNMYPDPNLITEVEYIWNDLVLEPGQTVRIEAESPGPVQTAYIPFHVVRTTVKNWIVDKGKMITTVIVTPEIELTELDVEIQLSTLLEEPVEDHNAFGTLTQDANSCSHAHQWFSRVGDKITDKMTWHLDPVGLEPVTFQVSHIIDVNELFYSAVLTPQVTVSGVPVEQDMMQYWQGDTLWLDAEQYIRVRSNASLNFFQGIDRLVGFSLRMPSVNKVSPISDVTLDGQTDLLDLALFSEWWLTETCDPNNTWCQRTDFTRDGIVALSDFARLSADWTILEPQVLLEDSFNDGDFDGWTVHDPGDQSTPSAWAVSDGILYQTSHIYSNPTAPSSLLKNGTYLDYNNGFGWTDYVVRCTIRSRGYNDCGVMFRVQDENNYYRFSWNRQVGYARLVKVVGGVATLLDSVDSGYMDDILYEVEVRAQEDQLEVSIDGTLWLSATDSEFTSGSIGLYTWGNAPVTYFDNVSVTE
ncbi:MAG: DUF1080 domain-containing protein [Sedimentisphaerales bacterium]|nr:DUF1080 domain-containing protein [Sedimentisphaerales bacterium]